MNETIEEIYNSFSGKLVGDLATKVIICEAVSKLPQDMIDFITNNIWFMSSFRDTWAYTFTGNDLKDMHLIFLSDDLLSQDTEQIKYTILHEIAHVVLGHKNSTHTIQTKNEIAHQESEADHFAQTHL